MDRTELEHRLRQYEGADFFTLKGKHFIYAVRENSILILNHELYISLDDLENVAAYRTLSYTDVKMGGFWGSSYIYGILSDPRFK